jgi:ribosome-associated protein
MNAREKTALLIHAAQEKKGIDIVALNVAGISDVADVFMIVSGTSTQHVQTIVTAIEAALRDAGEKDYHMEGYNVATWALIDSSDVVVHVFNEESRAYYGLERLWADAQPMFDTETSALHDRSAS